MKSQGSFWWKWTQQRQRQERRLEAEVTLLLAFIEHGRSSWVKEWDQPPGAEMVKETISSQACRSSKSLLTPSF
jgi:hypothetical protein